METEGASPKPPSIGCDQAIAEGEIVVHNELVLSGWATAMRGISGVVVQLDGRLLNASYGLETPWVAESKPDLPGADRAGYELRMDTSSWTPGTRALTITAFDRDGDRAELTGQVRILPYGEPAYTPDEARAAIEAGQTAMWVESPAIVEGPCEVEGKFEIRGWAYARDGLDSVRIMINGQAFEALRPIVRPDLLEEFGEEVASVAGFVLSLDPGECPPGRHRLTVVAVGADGNNVGVAGDVICVPESSSAPPGLGEPAPIDWLERRTAPHRRDDTDGSYNPELHRGTALDAEHQLRYRWAAELARGRTVLDAGCGAGYGAALLAEAGADRVSGIEESEDALSQARRRTDADKVELSHGRLDSLPHADASFDLITCFGAIEGPADTELALEELRRVLRPKGVLLISMAGHTVTPAGLERALRDRFRSVRLHRQQTCLASTMLDDEALAIDDGELDLEFDVRKLAPGRPGGEDHTVAVAGDGALPDTQRMAMLASPRGIRQLHDSARTWEDRALVAEAEAAALRVQSNLARIQQEGTTKILRERDEELEHAAETTHELETVRERLAERLTEQEQHLAERQEQLAEQQEQLAKQDERLAHRDEQIALQAGLEERLAKQERQLIERQERLAEQEEQLAEQGRQIKRAGQIENELEQLRAALADQLDQCDALIDSQAATLGARNVELRVLTERLRKAEVEAETWATSRSVRFTRPLRAIRRGLRRIAGALLRRNR